MQKKSTVSKKSILLVVVLLLAVCLLTYLPGMTQLGFYRDDWNNLFNAYTQGADMLIQHYQSDRPADGYLLRSAYQLFGPRPYPYLLACLACRFLSALFFWAALLLVWPRQKAAAFSASALFIVYPGFLQQVDGLAYLPHQFAMLCFCLSLTFTILALNRQHFSAKVLCCLAAVLFALAEMFLMEYYIGLEGLRLLLVGAWVYNQRRQRGLRLFGTTLLCFFPFLIGMAGFLYWRSFLFDATRYGADVSDVLGQLLANPRVEGLSLLAKWIKNAAKLTFGAWTIPAYNLLNGSSFSLFLKGLGWALLSTLLVVLTVRQLSGRPIPAAENEKAAEPAWQAQWILLGLASTFIALLPMLAAGREITYISSLDRFTYPGSLCAIFFLTGLVFSISPLWLRGGLLGVMMLSAGLVQYVNKADAIENWRQTREFWWQLSWRAPMISEGTLVLPNLGDYPAEEDYETFTPIHLIYRPEFDHATIATEVLNQSAIQDVQMGTVTFRKVRQIYIDKDFNHLLAITRPVHQSCLQVIDGKNPVYSTNEWSRIPEAGAWSNPSAILTNEEPHRPDENIFGQEPQHGWCYYYQKMSLSIQKEDWQSAAALADEALAAGLEPTDRVEWLPLVQAFAYCGRMDDAEKYVERIRESEYLRFESCKFFTNAAESTTKNQENKAGANWLRERICTE